MLLHNLVSDYIIFPPSTSVNSSSASFLTTSPRLAAVRVSQILMTESKAASGQFYKRRIIYTETIKFFWICCRSIPSEHLQRVK